VATPKEDREPIRCTNELCPSRNGAHGSRIVVERGLRTGWYYLKVGTKDAQPLYARLIMPASIPCASCGQLWLNPGLQLIDGVQQIFDEAVGRAADQLRENPPDSVRRRRLRPNAA
jgi:hypothetical protein